MKTSIYFDDKTWDKIKVFADDHGLTISFAVRYCINEFIKK
jgi:hypothetical protein